jgi:hypothetical protein
VIMAKPFAPADSVLIRSSFVHQIRAMRRACRRMTARYPIGNLRVTAERYGRCGDPILRRPRDDCTCLSLCVQGCMLLSMIRKRQLRVSSPLHTSECTPRAA